MFARMMPASPAEDQDGQPRRGSDLPRTRVRAASSTGEMISGRSGPPIPGASATSGDLQGTTSHRCQQSRRRWGSHSPLCLPAGPHRCESGGDQARSVPASKHRADRGTERGESGGGQTGTISRLPWSGVVGRVGLEPTTYGLKVRNCRIGAACSVSACVDPSASRPISLLSNVTACRFVSEPPSRQRAAMGCW